MIFSISSFSTFFFSLSLLSSACETWHWLKSWDVRARASNFYLMSPNAHKFCIPLTHYSWLLLQNLYLNLRMFVQFLASFKAINNSACVWVCVHRAVYIHFNIMAIHSVSLSCSIFAFILFLFHYPFKLCPDDLPLNNKKKLVFFFFYFEIHFTPRIKISPPYRSFCASITATDSLHVNLHLLKYWTVNWHIGSKGEHQPVIQCANDKRKREIVKKKSISMWKYVVRVSADVVNKTGHYEGKKSNFAAWFKAWWNSSTIIRTPLTVVVPAITWLRRKQKIPDVSVCIWINQIQYEIFTAFRHLSRLWIITAHFREWMSKWEQVSVRWELGFSLCTHMYDPMG